MNLVELAALSRAVGIGLTAFGDELARGIGATSPLPLATAPPAPVSTPDPARDTPGHNLVLDGATPAANGADRPTADRLLADAMRQALAHPASMAPPKRRRKVKRPARYRADGSIGADWSDDELGDVLSQKGCAELLGLSRPQLLQVEAAGRITRHLSRGKVCYLYGEAMELKAMVDRHEAAQAQDVTEA